MNVEDVMTAREAVVTVEIPGTRDDVLEYLQREQFSSVPAIKQTDDGEVYRGIISRTALIDRPNEDQLAMLAEDISPTARDTSLSALADRMLTEGERRIPVSDDDSLEGIITVTDAVRAIARGEGDDETLVEDIAEPAVNCLYSETPLTVAEQQLSFAHLPYAVALDDDGEMCGIVTEVDIIAVARVVEGEEDTGESIANQDDDWAWEGIKAVGNRYMPTRNVEIPNGPVSKFMTEDLVTLGGKSTAQKAAQLMIEHDIEQIPVVSGGRLDGIVQDIHLLEALR